MKLSRATHPYPNPYAKADVRTPMMDGENTCDRQNNHQSTNKHLGDGQATESSRMVRHNDEHGKNKPLRMILKFVTSMGANFFLFS